MRLPITLLLLLLTIQACAPVVKPMGAVRGPPSLTKDALIASDGAALPLRRWLPRNGKARAVIVALHGFNDYANALAMPAPFWADRGIATYAYDQRGFGGAPNRGYWAGAGTLTADLRDAVRAVRLRHPRSPLFVLGVSMGGAVVLSALADAPIDGVAGVVLIAPAVWGRKHLNAVQRAALWLLSNTVPAMRLTGEGLRIKPSDNIEMLRALARDPKIIRETRVDAIKGLVDLMDSAFAAAPRLGPAPVLVAYGLRDEIVPRRPTTEFMQHMQQRAGTRRAFYKSGYHMLLRDKAAGILWRDIASWIGDPAKPLPSGADERAEAFLAARDGAPAVADK
jgi:alpha-beta hydrolase superfamily lysophospholipase